MRLEQLGYCWSIATRPIHHKEISESISGDIEKTSEASMLKTSWRRFDVVAVSVTLWLMTSLLTSG